MLFYVCFYSIPFICNILLFISFFLIDSTDKTEFSSSEWEGLYSCDNKQHSYPLFLNATKPKDKLTIGATLSFRTITVQVSGTYSSWSRALALQVETSLLYENHNLTKIALETREISTSGMIGQLSLYKADGGKLTCVVDPLSLKKGMIYNCCQLLLFLFFISFSVFTMKTTFT